MFRRLMNQLFVSFLGCAFALSFAAWLVSVGATDKMLAYLSIACGILAIAAVVAGSVHGPWALALGLGLVLSGCGGAGLDVGRDAGTDGVSAIARDAGADAECTLWGCARTGEASCTMVCISTEPQECGGPWPCGAEP